ncbi:acyl carrier protein [Streptomyces platensis]|uniref:Acyl carrier protein n=1 Tax=Streptomyces platensis TaxID=58346 RepID=A0AAE6TK74_STRPT|nr:acyl carrier protein [Streptomyces platensis]OSY46304.1 Acyl carrier protein [Streptomyces platensis]QEV50341.1 acyl carrier protein [Streptomyces platensis]
MAGADRTAVGQENADAVLEEVRHVLEEQCEISAEQAGAVTASAPFADLGLDSITLAYVFTYFERKHDLTFENGDIDPTRYATVGELVEAIARRVHDPAGH